MNELSDIDLAWLAGFVDGEGYIGIVRQRKKNGSWLYHPWIILTSTSEELVDEVSGLIKIGKRAFKRRTGVCKAAYQLKITKFSNIEMFLESVGKYLKLKGLQADLVLQFCKLRRDAKIITGRGSGGRSSFGENENMIYMKLKELNKRGAV